MYLHAKFQTCNIILTGFRQNIGDRGKCNFTNSHPKRIPRNPTLTRVKKKMDSVTI